MKLIISTFIYFLFWDEKTIINTNYCKEYHQPGTMCAVYFAPKYDTVIIRHEKNFDNVKSFTAFKDSISKSSSVLNIKSYKIKAQ